MSVITRRTWTEILAEALRGAKGKNYSSYSSRLQYHIYEAYLDLAHLFHHAELETSANSTLATGANTINFQTDAYLIMAVAELDSNSLPKKYVKPIDLKVLSGVFLGSNSGQPEQYASFGRVITFDRKTDIDRTYKVYYMKHPAAPDFTSSNTPDTGSQWDAHIIDLALMRAALRDGDMESAKVYAEAFRDFASQQLKPALKDSFAPNFGNNPAADRFAGGAQT